MIGLSLYLPFFLIEIFQIQNRIVSGAMCQIMTTLFFRVLEAMYGTYSSSSPYVTKSFSNHIGYMSSVVPYYIWDPKTELRAKNFIVKTKREFR